MITGLSKIWDGDPIDRVRGEDGAAILPGRRLSAHLMMQPDVASILLGDRLSDGQGLLSRMLMTAPESATGTRLWREEQPGTDRDIENYGACVLSILEAKMPLAPGKRARLNNSWVKMTGCRPKCGFAESQVGYLNKEMDWLRMQVRYSRGRR